MAYLNQISTASGSERGSLRKPRSLSLAVLIENKQIMNREDRIKNFEEFWPYYVREHRTAGCRLLHFIGSGLGVICLISTIVTGNLWFIPLGLALGYGFAWVGHFFVEHNKPATFQYPLWSFRADWRMWRFMLFGRMREEVERVERAVRA
jgi:hypothetical protein